MSNVAKELITSFLLFTVILLKRDYFSTLANPDDPDVRKFYVKDAKIWIVNTTMLTSNFCEVDFVWTTSQKYAFFNRSYFRNHTTRKLLGQFRPGRSGYDTMMVAPYHGTSFESMDQLLHSYQNYTCGIFNVTLLTRGRTSYYDIRVKQAEIASPSSSCIEKFRQLFSRQRITTLYNETCQNNRQW
uniref:Lipocalin n=1 Tax=Rhipicephalus zambeziensis TaxID=60191 RepID=A0A224YMV1_9ACAR